MANKILIVDDEKIVRALIRKILENEQYEVIESTNGYEAVESAKKENPDVILLDMKMPVMDGIETCRRLRADEKTKNIPILVITALGETKMEAIKAGVDDFINKPFDTEEVIIRVKSMLKIKNLTDGLQRISAYGDGIAKQKK